MVGCGQPVDIKNIAVKYRGGCVKVSTTCNGNHYMEVVLKNKQDLVKSVQLGPEVRGLAKNIWVKNASPQINC